MLKDEWMVFHNKEKINDRLSKTLGESNYNSQNYLEQLSHICNDFDEIIKKSIEDLSRSDILAAVTYTWWAIEAVDCIYKELNDTFSINLITSSKYNEIHKFVIAIRSFIVAHPLETNRHPKFGLDGTYILTDIYSTWSKFIRQPNDIIYLSIKGCNNKPSKNKSYIYLKVYPTKNNGNTLYQKWFALSFSDLEYSISYCIKTLDDYNKILKKSIKK